MFFAPPFSPRRSSHFCGSPSSWRHSSTFLRASSTATWPAAAAAYDVGFRPNAPRPVTAAAVAASFDSGVRPAVDLPVTAAGLHPSATWSTPGSWEAGPCSLSLSSESVVVDAAVDVGAGQLRRFAEMRDLRRRVEEEEREKEEEEEEAVSLRNVRSELNLPDLVPRGERRASVPSRFDSQHPMARHIGVELCRIADEIEAQFVREEENVPDLDEIDAAEEVAVGAAADAAPVLVAPAVAAAPTVATPSASASASAPTTGSFRRMSNLVRRFSDWNNQRRVGSVPSAHFGDSARDRRFDN